LSQIGGLTYFTLHVHYISVVNLKVSVNLVQWKMHNIYK